MFSTHPPTKLVAVEEQRVHNIQTVIDTFRKAIDDMYVTTRFTNQRHHYRTKELKRQFKEANSSFMNCTILLEHLTSSLNKARENLARVDDALEVLSHDSTKSDKKRAALVTKQSDRVACIKKAVKQIKLLKNKRDQEEILWRQKAKLIFDECQKQEVKRLDLMKKTLLDFTQAMQIKDQQTVDHIYLTLAKDIQTKQNSKTDVEWWAKVYGAIEEEEVLENDEIDTSGHEQDDDTV
ncbi:unnamed protein product [Didymodactylos carnosus]|uniref:Uncharacterized protein n=2 Tax=Didymodactylos carnosus TaxID=1234261 RepID=A0A8S2YTA6_9BILA|nr:unnamed protein product [Didymodactylos carnosus]